MGTADIQVEIDSMPAKKEDLRKAFEDLLLYSSSFTSFSLQWKDIDEYLSSTLKSIEESFQELKTKVAPQKPTAAVSAANVKEDQDKTVIEARPELKSSCVNMDAKGLRSYIMVNRGSINAMRSELDTALQSSPDPVTLVLDSFDGFVPSNEMTEGEIHAIRRACSTILECLHGLQLEIKPSDKERARSMAYECEELITDGKGGNAVVVMVFLQLIATFGLLEYFALDHILELLVTVANKKCVVNLCRNSVLEEKIPDLVVKLNNKGRQLDSLKFVLAFNIQYLYPPASLFKAYLKESRRDLKIDMRKGNISVKLKNEAISKLIAAHKAVIKAVEEYNLDSLFPRVKLRKHIVRLEMQRPEKKRGPTAFAASTSNNNDQMQQHQPPNKRPRPSNSAATVLPPHPHSQIQHQLGLVDRAPYLGLASTYSLSAAPSLYSVGSANLSGNPIGLGGSVAPPNSYLYPSESLADSAYYDRPVSYGGYFGSGLPPPYNPSPYP